MAKELRITWAKSSIGYPKTQKLTIKSLGLQKLQDQVVKKDTPAIRGELNKVRHLLTVVEID